MQYIQVDLLQVEKSEKGYTFILVAIDQMSAFVWLRPLITKQMDGVAKELVGIFSSFGFPEKLKSDKGSEFWNEVTARICRVAKTKQLSTVAYDHHANGVVERAVRSARDTVESGKS